MPARSSTCCTVMVSNGFSCISVRSASPSPSRVRRTRRSIFGVDAAVFRDIQHLFVQDRRTRFECGLTALALPSTVRRMTDDRLSGLALISGSGGMIITMSLHPTGHVAAAQVEPMIHMLIAVHALALACVPVQFLGAWGLSRRVASPDRLAVAGLVLYALALLAVMNAAVADGLVPPSLL